MNEPEKEFFLVLDIGTSLIKCGCIDGGNHMVARFEREFPMTHHQDGYEIDFNLFFNTAGDLLKQCMENGIVQQSGIKALLITSQAQTFAPVNADFSPIRTGMVWLDERAGKEASWLKDRLPGFAGMAGYNAPVPGLYISKMLWLKRNEPSVFNEARAFPLINEYLAYKLTGEFYSDSTGFGMSGMYDYHTNGLNKDLLKILGLSKEHFPKVENAAARGELISPQIRDEWKLEYRFPVYLCGNDQSASAVGAGLKQPGDVNINFGTAMVLYTLTESLTTGLKAGEIAGKHTVGDDYFLLSYENDFGIQIRRFKDDFFEHGTYDEVYKTCIQYPDAAEQDPRSMPDDLHLMSGPDLHRFCAGIIKHYLARLRTSIARLRESMQLKNVFISGGMSQSEVWLDILRENIDAPLEVNFSADAGLFGALDAFLHQNKAFDNEPFVQ